MRPEPAATLDAEGAGRPTVLVMKVSSRDQDWPQPLPAAFIVGVTRSGTTLLRMMLDAHPQLAIPPETHFIPEVAAASEGAANPADTFTAVLTSHPRWPDFHIDGELLRATVRTIEPFDLTAALRSFYRLYAGRLGKLRWSDKTPAYVYRMRLIQSLLPEARFVHLIRDGRDAALSIRDLSFGPNTISEAALLWVERITAARRQVEELRYYLEVRYEDLVLDPERTLNTICGFIDLPWSPEMLNYHAKSAVRLAEVNRDLRDHSGRLVVSAEERVGCHRLITQPPQVERIGRWRTGMSRADRQCYESIAGSMLRNLGYEV